MKKVKSAPAVGTVPLAAIHLNDGTHGLPKNPRFIRDERFRALCDSIRDNPEYMPARPIIVDEAGTVLGGNMRLRACRELKIDPLPAGWVVRVDGWTVEKKRRFIILDNRQFGGDSWEDLANEWSMEVLIAAGFSEADLTGLEVPEGGQDEKPVHTPTASLSFPPRVWLTQRAEIVKALQPIIDSFGGAAEWPE